MNNKGQLIIGNLMLYVVVLVIIIGFFVYLNNTIDDRDVSVLTNYEANQLVEDTMKMLVETEGTPTDWQYASTSDVLSIGLKKNSTTNLISYNKLVRLTDESILLDNLLSDAYSYSLTIESKTNSTGETIIAGSKKSNKNIYSKSQPVIIDYDYDTTYIKDEENQCSLGHDNSQYSCKVFSINKTQLDKGEYYIVSSDTSAGYILQNSYNDQVTGSLSDGVSSINSQISSLQRQDNETITIHMESDEAFLVYDTNNRKEYLDSVLNPPVYILTLNVYT